MRYKIGVFGSAEDFDKSLITKVRDLGKILGQKRFIVITGATSGLPYLVSFEAFKNGAEIWGYSYEQNLEDIKKRMLDHDTSIYKQLVYVPKNFPFASNIEICRKYRNVISTANCDAGIIISGRWGTMNEFTNLFDMGKVIGILTETGGIADELVNLYPKVSKKNNAKVFFSNSSSILVEKIITELKNRKSQRLF